MDETRRGRREQKTLGGSVKVKEDTSRNNQGYFLCFFFVLNLNYLNFNFFVRTKVQGQNKRIHKLKLDGVGLVDNRPSPD